MAMSIPAVIHEPFSGMLDMETGDGALFDIHGMSRILLTEHDDDLLCFEKQYMEKGGVTPRGPIISYALRKDPHTGVYIGTWERGERENEGLAIMVLNQMPIPFESYVDHTYLLKKITQLSPESEGLRRWHEEREKTQEFVRQSQEEEPCGLHPDWEIIRDVLDESGIEYIVGDSPGSNGQEEYPPHDGDGHDDDDLPF